MATKARELARHFETQGTPVMIGALFQFFSFMIVLMQLLLFYMVFDAHEVVSCMATWTTVILQEIRGDRSEMCGSAAVLGMTFTVKPAVTGITIAGLP